VLENLDSPNFLSFVEHATQFGSHRWFDMKKNLLLKVAKVNVIVKMHCACMNFYFQKETLIFPHLCNQSVQSRNRVQSQGIYF
jgi:hypothetical protein